jgi:hypothetical protein
MYMVFLLVLLDGNLRFVKGGKNARFQFGQSKAHGDYLWSVFCSLSPLCASLPYATTGVCNGVQCYAVRFYTRCLPIFTELHGMFYDWA